MGMKINLDDIRGKKVLIVDDDAPVADLISDIMGGLGCETRVLYSGEAVHETARDWKPELITLDIQMPGKSGIECLAELKGDPATRDIPVVIISVVARRPDILRQLVLAAKVIEKPLTVQTLTDCIALAVPSR